MAKIRNNVKDSEEIILTEAEKYTYTSRNFRCQHSRKTQNIENLVENVIFIMTLRFKHEMSTIEAKFSTYEKRSLRFLIKTLYISRLRTFSLFGNHQYHLKRIHPLEGERYQSSKKKIATILIQDKVATRNFMLLPIAFSPMNTRVPYQETLIRFHLL